MTTQERSAIVRKASAQIETRVPLMWDMYPGLSKEVVHLVLEIADEKTNSKK